MKINKLVLLLFFPIMAQLIFSCCCCDDDPVVPNPQNAWINQIDLYPIDNANNELQVLSNYSITEDSVDKNEFGIYIIGQADYIAQCLPKRSKSLFFSPAFACTCNDYIPFRAQKVSNFKIRTLTKFDSLISVGDEITNHFKIYNPNDSTYQEIPSDSVDLNEELYLLLFRPPVYSDKYSFEVSFDANDSLSVIDTTTSVFLF